jgi:hypothetical protein
VDYGKRLLYVTDGNATKSSITYDQIIAVAKKRHVKISFVSATLLQENLDTLQKVALSTGGQFYAH